MMSDAVASFVVFINPLNLSSALPIRCMTFYVHFIKLERILGSKMHTVVLHQITKTSKRIVALKVEGNNFELDN